MILEEPVSKYYLKSTMTIEQNESVGFLITEMSKHRYRRFPVIDADQHPVGMVTSSDIIGSLQALGDSSFLKQPIHEIMSDRIVIINEDTSVRETIDLMYNIGISGVPIVKDNIITGIVTEKDLLVVDRIWKDVKDSPISENDGPGRPVLEESIVNEDFTFWQIADRLVNLAQRQLLVKESETSSFIGLITHMTLLNSLLNTITISNPDFASLQTIRPPHMVLKSLFQRAIPMMVSSARLWMNSRGIEAFPLYHRGRPIKLITEKDLVGYLANNI